MWLLSKPIGLLSICISVTTAAAADHPYVSLSYIFKTNFGNFGMTRAPIRKNYVKSDLWPDPVRGWTPPLSNSGLNRQMFAFSYALQLSFVDEFLWWAYDRSFMHKWAVSSRWRCGRMPCPGTCIYSPNSVTSSTGFRLMTSPNSCTINRHSGATTPSQHVWSSDFLRCGSDGMELAPTLTPGPCSEYRVLQIGAENSSFCGAKGRLKARRDALYKSTTTTTTTTTRPITTLGAEC